MRLLFGILGAIGHVLTHQYMLFVLMYYILASGWHYPMFMLFLVTFPLVLISLGFYVWRTIRLETMSFPSMAMFFMFYFPVGVLYGLSIAFSMKSFSYPNVNLQRFLVASVPCDFAFISFIPVLVLRRPFAIWPILACLITLPLPWLYNFMSYDDEWQEWSWKVSRYGNAWQPWILVPFARFFLITACALNKLGLLHKSKFKYHMIERLTLIQRF